MTTIEKYDGNGPNKEQIQKMLLHGTVRIPAPTRGTATIARPKGSYRNVLVIRNTCVVNSKACEEAHFERSVLLEHVTAIFQPADAEKPFILRLGDEGWHFGKDEIETAIQEGKSIRGMVFVRENKPVFVESSLGLPFVAFAAEEGDEVDVDSPPKEGICC